MSLLRFKCERGTNCEWEFDQLDFANCITVHSLIRFPTNVSSSLRFPSVQSYPLLFNHIKDILYRIK